MQVPAGSRQNGQAAGSSGQVRPPATNNMDDAEDIDVRQRLLPSAK